MKLTKIDRSRSTSPARLNKYVLRGALLLLALVVAPFASSAVSAATAGDLDLSFGVAGKAITTFPNAATARAVAIQADGKIVVAGGFPGFAVARYTRDGQLDPTFGNGGIAFTVLGPSTNLATALVIQPDGKIVLAGSSGTNNSDQGITLVRFTASGSLDSTFGGDGVASVELSGSETFVNGLALQPSGALVAVGTTSSDALVTYDAVVARFTANGVPDPSFGVNGIIREHTTQRSGAAAVLVGPDGKILVGGATYVGPFAPGLDDYDFLLYRYNADGSRDNSFGVNGRSTVSIGAGTDEIYALALQTDGKIIAAGRVLSDNFDMAIVRLTNNGNLDVGNFGSGGKVLINVAGDRATSVAVDPNGYIVATGNGGNDMLLARLEPDGDLDPNFGIGGKALVQLPSSNSFANGLALQPTNFTTSPNNYKIVVVGVAASENNRFLTLRFRSHSGPIERAVVNDFDGNGLSDAANFRASTGDWIIGRIIFPQAPITKVDVAHWGATGDQLAPGDFDGDGIYDLSVYRGGGWHIRISGNGGSYRAVSFGLPGDIPVPADYDGDGRTDVAVFRPSNGAWYYLRSSDGSFVGAIWGVNGDIPTVGDFDGDDKSDLAVFRNGIWYILQSGNGQLRIEYFGLASDKPIAFDYDQDSISDVAVFRDGFWYWLGSSDHVMHALAFGGAGDIPVPGKYDRGVRTVAIFRNGFWQFEGNNFSWASGAGNVPVPTVFAQ